jgi:hypothetical protein
MKINTPNTSFYTVLLLIGAKAYCQGPPEPGDPPPPDGPINENINILLIIALLFGTYTIYKHLNKNKRPT